jgi:hypothetical protein
MNKIAKQKSTLVFIILGGLTMVAAGRFLPHPPNFTPLVGLAIFGSFMIKRRVWAYALPILFLWLTDLVLNNFTYGSYYEGWVWISQHFIWSSLALSVIVLAAGVIRKLGTKASSVIGTSLFSSTIFFLVSNFGVWMISSTLYSRDITGLLTAYTAGLPFYLNGIAGDLFYTGLLFGAYYLFASYGKKLQTI